MYTHFGNDGSFLMELSKVANLFHHAKDAIKQMGEHPKKPKVDRRLRSAQAQNEVEAEVEHVNVRDGNGDLWDTIRPAMRLLLALSRFRAVAKMAYLRYFTKENKKPLPTTVFLAPGTSGYFIPGYTYDSIQPAVTAMAPNRSHTA